MIFFLNFSQSFIYERTNIISSELNRYGGKDIRVSSMNKNNNIKILTSIINNADFIDFFEFGDIKLSWKRWRTNQETQTD